MRVHQRFELKSEQPDRGLGETWLAVDHGDGGRDVLVKYPAGALASPDAFNALIARLTGASPTGLLPLLAGGVEQGAPFVVYEESRSRSLADWLDGYREAGTQPSLGMVQSIFGKVCMSLVSAHQAGFVHRALSPRSVLLRRAKGGEPTALVVDLELAPFFTGEALLATRAWRAPEQDERAGQSRRTESAATDVFALGVMLAEMLTLQSGPVAGRELTWAEFTRKGADKVLVTLAALNRDVPDGVWAAVAKAISRTVAERPVDAQKFRAQVRGALQAAGRLTDVSPTENDPPVPTRRASLAKVSERAPASSQPVIEGWEKSEPGAPAKVSPVTSHVEPVSVAPRPASAAPSPPVASRRAPEAKAAAALKVPAAPSFAQVVGAWVEGGAHDLTNTLPEVPDLARHTDGRAEEFVTEPAPSRAPAVGAEPFDEGDEPATSVMSARALPPLRKARPGAETLPITGVGLDVIAASAARPRGFAETIRQGDDPEPPSMRVARAGSDTLPIDGDVSPFGALARFPRDLPESADGTMMIDDPAPRVPVARASVVRPIAPVAPSTAVGRGFDAFAQEPSPSDTLPITGGLAPGVWIPPAVSQVPSLVPRPLAPGGGPSVAAPEGFPWAILAAVVMVGAALGVLVFALTR